MPPQKGLPQKGLLGDLVNMRNQALQESKRLYHAIEKLEPTFTTWNKLIKENTEAQIRLAKVLEKKR